MRNKKRLFFDPQSAEMSDKFGTKETRLIMTPEGLRYVKTPFSFTGNEFEGIIEQGGTGGINSSIGLAEGSDGVVRITGGNDATVSLDPLEGNLSKDMNIQETEKAGQTEGFQLGKDVITTIGSNPDQIIQVIDTEEKEETTTGGGGIKTTGGGGGGGGLVGGGGGGQWQDEPKEEPEAAKDDLTAYIVGAVILGLLIFFGYRKGGKK